MSVESYKELDDFFRSMRQAFNSRDLKLFRSHFWTDKRFVHMDASGRTDQGWGSYEEVLDQEFRYLDVLKLELKDMGYQIFGDQFASVSGNWRATQVDLLLTLPPRVGGDRGGAKDIPENLADGDDVEGLLHILACAEVILAQCIV